MKQVIIYSTPTCVYCKLAKDFLQKHAIEFVEHNVADDLTARATMVGYVQIIFAGAWGVLLFDESITWWTIVGASMILMGMLSLVLVHREAVGIDE